MHRSIPARALTLVSLTVVSLTLALSGAPSSAAERLIVNAKVYTASATRPYAEAVAIRDSTIVAVGSRAEAARALGNTPEIIDAGGRTLLPGLIDSHVHAALAGVALLGVDVANDVHSIAKLAEIARAGKANGRALRGDVLQVYGIPIDVWSHIDELNATFNGGEFADQAVFLLGMDGHTAWGNSTLRKRVGLDAKFIGGLTPAQRAYYGYAPDLTPNGFAVDAGRQTLDKALPPLDAARLQAAAGAALDYLHGFGITSFLDPLVDDKTLAAYAALARAGKLTAHVAGMIEVKPDDRESLPRALALRARYMDVPGLAVSGIKVFADGVVEYPSQTAAMWAPYGKTGHSGDLLFRPENFRALCVEADRRGLIVHTHAIGDRAVTETLDGIEAARRANGDSGLPHTITHLQFVRPADQARFAPLGVIASYQLLWAEAGEDTIDLVQPYVDPAIYPWMYPARSMLDAGAVIAGASDWFVSSPNPFLAIYQAETRRGPRGVLDAGQAMPREAMLRAYTINAARALHEEQAIGSIEAGKAADLVLLDRDVLTVPAESVRDTRVVWTMVAGNVVYRAP